MVQVVQRREVISMIDVDTNIKGSYEQILGDNSTVAARRIIDVKEVVGIGYCRAGYFGGGKVRHDRIRINGGSRSAGIDLVRVMEYQIGYSRPETIQSDKRRIGVGDQKRWCDRSQGGIDSSDIERPFDRSA